MSEKNAPALIRGNILAALVRFALPVLLALVITALVVPFAGPLAGLLHAPAEAYEQTAAYLRICGLGTVFITAYNVLGAVFRGLGDSRTPLLTVAIACGVNIVGDLVLVAGFGLGAACASRWCI